MSSGSRRILTVMVVTAALCADRAVAAPAVRAEPVEIGGIAQRLVGKLAQKFRQAVPATCCLARRPIGCQVNVAAAQPLDPPLAAHQPVNPFQFRLPPPLA